MSTKIIKIGNREVEAGYFPDKDFGYEYCIEVHPYDRADSFKRFFLRSLSKINCAALPNSCLMVFLDPKPDFNKISLVEILNDNEQCHLKLVLDFCYLYWDMKESLPSFIDRYCDEIKKNITQLVTTEKYESGFMVICKFDISEANDIYEYYSRTDIELERSYRSILFKYSNEVVPQVYGSGKIHWWIRYVFVPLAGSGAIATVLAKYLLK